MSSLAFEIAVVLILILLNGIFSLSEMALASSRQVRLKRRAQTGNRGAGEALQLFRDKTPFFSTVQVGITLIGIFTGTFGGATLSERLSTYLQAFPTLAPYAGFLGIVVVVAPITYLTLILGELVPKRLGVTHPEAIASMTAPPMRVLMRLTAPAVRLLSLSTDVVVRLLGMTAPTEPNVTEEDIRMLLGEGAKTGVVEEEERDMVERIFMLGDRQVGALMTHRTRIVWLDLEDTPEENLRTVLDSPYSFYPVALGDLAETIGIVSAKDVLAQCAREAAARAGQGAREPGQLCPGIDLRTLVRPPLFVPETMRALRLLELFRKSPLHYALIVDEYGDVQGVVTLNDVLEAIVGDLPTGEVDESPDAVQRDDGSWLLDGLMPLDEVRETLGITRSMSEEEWAFQTLAGFVLKMLDRIPAMGDRFDWNGFRFEVVDMDGHRIDRVLVSPLPQTGEVDDTRE